MTSPPQDQSAGPSLRIDKWLWYARFFKTRTLAARLCNGSKLRIAGEIVSKAHHKIKVGDILTFPQARQVRVIKILALGTRRGPAAEAHELYEDLDPPSAKSRLPGSAAAADKARGGSGRPTKRDRRALVRLKNKS